MQDLLPKLQSYLQKLLHSSTLPAIQKTVDAKQVMNLLLLEANLSSKIKVSVEGEDAKAVLNELTQIFEDRFGEN